MKEGRTYKKLGGLCRIRTGKLDANAANDNGTYPFFTCSVTPLRINNYAYDCECVLVAGNGDLNVKYYYGKFNAYQRTYIIESADKNVLDVRYLYMFLSEYVTILRKKSIGAIIKYIKLGYLTEAKIPLPSLSEQKSIVDYLDSAFAKIDTMKANAEKALNEAKALFQASLKEMLEPKEGWEDKKLGEIADYVRGPFGGSLTKSMFKPTGYAVYEQQHAIHKHINIRYFIDYEKFKEMERFSVEAGDIIMSCSGVTLGKVNILPHNAPAGIINQALLKMRVRNIIDVHYFAIWLESDYFQKIIQFYSGGAAIPNVPSVKILKDIDIIIPPLSEQHSIVANLDSLKSKVDRLQENFDKISQETDALKQAILRQVFE